MADSDTKPEKDDLEVDDLDTVAGGGADPKMQPDNLSNGCLREPPTINPTR
jgi:hypothetical protein